METLAAKVVIAFFYLMNGDLVSYTVSDYATLAEAENFRAGQACVDMIRDVGFLEQVRSGLAEGESMRAACYTTDNLMVLGEPDAQVEINRD